MKKFLDDPVASWFDLLSVGFVVLVIERNGIARGVVALLFLLVVDITLRIVSAFWDKVDRKCEKIREQMETNP